MMADREKTYFNFFALALDDGISVMAQEIFVAGEIVDVELWQPYRMDKSRCDEQAVLRNRQAVREGDHVSLYFMGIESQLDERQVGAA